MKKLLLLWLSTILAGCASQGYLVEVPFTGGDTIAALKVTTGVAFSHGESITIENATHETLFVVVDRKIACQQLLPGEIVSISLSRRGICNYFQSFTRTVGVYTIPRKIGASAWRKTQVDTCSAGRSRYWKVLQEHLEQKTDLWIY